MVTAETLRQYELLKGEYIRLLNDKDVLINWGKPQLEAVYTSQVGQYQVEQLQLQLTIKGLKRKIELVHAAINTNSAVDITDIELQVGEELANAELAINTEVQKLENAKYLLSHLDTPERSAELRKTFKHIAKALHPDVNPGITPEQLEIWHKMKDAYASGDLERLKALEVVYEKEIAAAQTAMQALTTEELQLRIITLSAGIKLLDEEIAGIRSQFPFSMEAQIKDEDWVKEQQELLSGAIDRLKQYEKELRNEYKQLTELYGN